MQLIFSQNYAHIYSFHLSSFLSALSSSYLRIFLVCENSLGVFQCTSLGINCSVSLKMSSFYHRSSQLQCCCINGMLVWQLFPFSVVVVRCVLTITVEVSSVILLLCLKLFCLFLLRFSVYFCFFFLAVLMCRCRFLLSYVLGSYRTFLNLRVDNLSSVWGCCQLFFFPPEVLFLLFSLSSFWDSNFMSIRVTF